MLLDLLLYLALASLLLAGQMSSSINALKLSVGTAAGQYAVQLQSGVNLYILTNNVALGSATPSVLGFVDPLKPTVTELINKKYLPVGISATSPLNLTFQVSLAATNCPGTNCTITGMVYTPTGYLDPDGVPDMRVIAKARDTIGIDGSVSFPGSGLTLQGYTNSYALPNPAGNVPGVLAIRVGSNSGLLSLLTQFYKLDGTTPLAGTMDVNNNNINNVNNLTVNGTAATANLTITGDALFQGTAAAGAVCTASQVKSVRLNSNGTGLVVCYANVWQAVGNTIANIADGSACSTSGQLGTSATGVAYVCDGAAWTPVQLFATAGAACATAGQLAISVTTREELVCRSGKWLKFQNLMPKNVQMARYSVTDGAIVTKPTCDTGGVASYSFSMSQVAMDIGKTPPRQAAYLSTFDNGASWMILIRVKDNSGGDFSATYLGVSAIFNTECSY